MRVPLEILPVQPPLQRVAQSGSAELRQILAMSAFAGAFLASVGSVVSWNGEIAGVRTPAATAVASAPSAPAEIASHAALVWPTPPPAPRPSPAAQRAQLASAFVTRLAAAAPPASAVVIGSYQQTLINQDRAAAGLPPLTWSSCLAGVAQQQASRMAAQGYMSHTDGISEDLSCGLGGFAGENLGYWTGGIDDTQLNSMFMASPEHRANILGNFRYVGTCWVVAPNGTAYIAVEFES